MRSPAANDGEEKTEITIKTFPAFFGFYMSKPKRYEWRLWLTSFQPTRLWPQLWAYIFLKSLSLPRSGYPVLFF
jgi:hypothetical protein